MSKTGFSSQDIVTIISALRDSRIARLKCGNLEINLIHTDSWGETIQPSADPAPPAVEVPVSTPLTRHQELPKVFDEDQIEQLKLEDPVEYERMLEAKEIIDGDTDIS
jgi:hypothetical protein